MRSVLVAVATLFIGITIGLPLRENEVDDLLFRVNELRRQNPYQDEAFVNYYARNLDSIGGGNLVRSVFPSGYPSPIFLKPEAADDDQFDNTDNQSLKQYMSKSKQMDPIGTTSGGGGYYLLRNDKQQKHKLAKRLDSIGGGFLVRSIDSFNGPRIGRSFDSIGGGNLVRALDSIGGGHLVKRTLDSIGGANLLKKKRTPVDLERNPLLYDYYASYMAPGYNDKRTFDEVDRRILERWLLKKLYDNNSNGLIESVDSTKKHDESPGLGKRNFDEIDRTSLGFKKRNFDEIDRVGFNAFKRNFDEIDRVGFNSLKRNFDEIDRVGFRGLKRVL